MGKTTISMAMFNSYVSLPEGKEDILVIVMQRAVEYVASNMTMAMV